MRDRKRVQEKLQKSLASCESRLSELRGKARSQETLNQLGELEQQIRACRLDVEALEEKGDNEWLEASYGVTRKVDDLQRSLQISSDRMEDFIR
jgi:hypothetical protein